MLLIIARAAGPPLLTSCKCPVHCRRSAVRSAIKHRCAFPVLARKWAVRYGTAGSLNTPRTLCAQLRCKSRCWRNGCNLNGKVQCFKIVILSHLQITKMFLINKIIFDFNYQLQLISALIISIKYHKNIFNVILEPGSKLKTKKSSIRSENLHISPDCFCRG